MVLVANLRHFRFYIRKLKQIYFITGTDTGVGKTVLTALLIKFLREQKINAAALKPICSGGRDDAQQIFAAMNNGARLSQPQHVGRRATAAAVTAALRNLLLSPDEINPWHFRAPIAPVLAARREKRKVKWSEVIAHVHAMQKRFNVLLVEGAGGLLSPLGENFDSRDLILKLQANPIIVAPNKLGVINPILLTLEALPENFRCKAKIVLMSPAKADASTASNAKLLSEFFDAKRIFQWPWFGKNFETARVLRNSHVRKTFPILAQ